MKVYILIHDYEIPDQQEFQVFSTSDKAEAELQTIRDEDPVEARGYFIYEKDVE